MDGTPWRQTINLLNSNCEDTQAVTVDHLTVSYGRRVALEHVSLGMESGSFVAVVGPNGAGKSTLLKAIVGVVGAREGCVSIYQRPVATERRRVAYVPQIEDSRHGFPASALDVVLMGRYRQLGWLRLPRRHDREVALGALAHLGLADRSSQPFSQLSGGQRQRVMFARALSQEPDVLLLDEPLNGIDLPAREVILDVIEGLRVEGKTIAMATHDLECAVRCCDCLCCVDGRLVAYGPTDVVVASGALARVYGG
ncbi:MAG TPA: ABC transporter ATP-binding protein [Dehalococcoidia bacterium]|nr:ABC transporter ATP-binding protein [Dehalococcoidia bacterium]